jgi:hypothetical protein
VEKTDRNWGSRSEEMGGMWNNLPCCFIKPGCVEIKLVQLSSHARLCPSIYSTYSVANELSEMECPDTWHNLCQDRKKCEEIFFPLMNQCAVMTL